ncbi:carbonic anhydrase [Peribacillus glennii]
MNSVDLIKNHPLMPENIAVLGMVIDPETGKLDFVLDGYNCAERNSSQI